MFSNVTSMTADEAAKALNTSMITFKKDVSDAMGILDSFNEIQNNYRTSAEDLASSISKVGAAARQAGISMEQLEGYTTGIVSSMGIGGNEAGTAIKSFISRLFRIGVEGQEDAGKSEELLKSLGIEIRKNATEFKSFDEILKEINRDWQNWSNVTKQTVAQQIGSQYHLSKFIALMDNFNIATSATEKALNSQGSAFKENQKYVNSLEGKINQLKLSFEKMYSSMLSSNLLKGVVDGITKLVTTFGNLPSVVVAATTALLLFKGKAITDGVLQIYKYMTTLKALAATEGVVKVTTMELSLAFNTLKTAFLTNPIGIIALGLTTVIGLFALFKDNTDKSTEALNKLDEQISNIKDNISALKDLSSSYIDLTSKTSLSTDEHTELLNTQNKIAELAPELIKAYDSEGNAIIKSKQELEDYIKQLKVAQAEKEGQKRDIYVKQLEEEQSKIKSLNKELASWNASWNEINQRKPDASFNNEQLATFDNYKIKLLKQVGKAITDLNIQLREAYENMQSIKDKIKEGIPEFASLEGIYKQIGNNIVSSFDKSFGDLNSENIYDYVDGIISISKSIQDSNFKEQYENYEKLNNSYKNGYITLNILKEAYDKLKDSLLKLGVKDNDINKFVQFDVNESSNYINLLDKLKNKLKEVDAEGQKNKDGLYNQFSVIEESVSDINNAIDKLRKGESLSADEIAKLTTKHEELSGKLVEVNGIYTLRLDVLENVRDSELQTQMASFEYNNKIKEYEWLTIKERLEQYGIFYDEISKMTSKSLSEQINKKVFESVKGGSLSEIISLQKLKKETEPLGQYIDTLTDLDKLRNNLIGKTKSDFGKKGSDPEPIGVQELTNEFLKAYNALANQDEKLAESLEKQIKIADAAKDYNKQITLTNQLIDIRKKKIIDLEAANKKITADANRVRSETKYDTTKWFDKDGGVTETYLNLIKSFEGKTDSSSKRQLDNIKKVFDALSNLKQGYIANTQEIVKQNDLISEQKQKLSDIARDQIKTFEDAQSKITDLIKKYYDQQEKAAQKSHDEEEKRLEEKGKKYKEYIDDNIKQLERQRDAENYSDDIEEKLKEINELQNKINSLTSAAMSGDTEAQSKIEDYQEELAKKQDDLVKTQTDRAFDLKKQVYQDDADEYEKYINGEKEKNDKHLDDYLTEIDKATSEARLKIESVNAITTEQVQLLNQSLSGEITTLTMSLSDLFTETGENATISSRLIEGEFLTSLTKVRDIYKEINSLYNIASGSNIKIPEIKQPSGNISGNINSKTALGNVINSALKDVLIPSITSILPNTNIPSMASNIISNIKAAPQVNFDRMLVIEGGTITKESIPMIEEKLNNVQTEMTKFIYNLFYKNGRG